MSKKFVVFLTPGILWAEPIEREVESYCVRKAVSLMPSVSRSIYAFYFVTKEWNEEKFSLEVTDRSCSYFINGEEKTFTDLEFEDSTDTEICRRNMKMNKIKKVCKGKFGNYVPMNDNDVILNIMDY